MAQRASFGKLQRDRDKKAKAAAKREKRQERTAERASDDTPAVELSQEGEVSAADLLILVERLHQGFEDGTIELEDFEQQKSELFARLPID